jgi:hypothetical protein
MNKIASRIGRWTVPAATGLLLAGAVVAQVPVDEQGNPVEAEVLGDTGDPQVADALLDDAELQELVGPIALYPDDLLAVVLPASAYPLQIVQAARFLQDLEENDDLEPDPAWDESVVALLNYPEVIEMMNADLEWTYALGEAVVQQQADVVAAIEAFRDRAYAAGNLKSDERQTVSRDEGVIQIQPVQEEVIYVPYYEPERVVVYQPTPVYHYYPRPYPVYYYPYPPSYSFFSGYFWGVTTAFRIGWYTDYLHVFHHSYLGHPYYGYPYFGHWYRRPSILIHNRYYVNDHVRRPPHHERDGDFWRPRRHGGGLIGRDQHREAYYADRRREHSEEGYRNAGDVRRPAYVGRDRGPGFRGDVANRRAVNAEPGFARSRANGSAGHDGDGAAARRQAGDDAIRFRLRERAGIPRSGSGDDPAIRFRPRPERSEAAAPRSGRDAPQRVTRVDRAAPAERAARPERRVDIERPSIDRATRPTIREHSASPRMRVTPERRAAPVQRAPSVQPRTSAPRASTPRASVPRAAPAPAPRVSRPSASSSPRAAARASRPAPRTEASSSPRSPRRAHQR